MCKIHLVILNPFSKERRCSVTVALSVCYQNGKMRVWKKVRIKFIYHFIKRMKGAWMSIYLLLNQYLFQSDLYKQLDERRQQYIFCSDADF